MGKEIWLSDLETKRFKTNDKSNKSFSENVFMSFIIVWSKEGLLIAGSKNSEGAILKYSQISKKKT